MDDHATAYARAAGRVQAALHIPGLTDGQRLQRIRDALAELDTELASTPAGRETKAARAL
jgi:hypothetical protein